VFFHARVYVNCEEVSLDSVCVPRWLTRNPYMKSPYIHYTIMPRHNNRRRNNNNNVNNSTSSISTVNRRMMNVALSHSPSVSFNIITRTVNYGNTASSNGAGIMNFVVSLAPNNFTDWSNLSVLYDEWRCLGAEIKFFCQQQNSITVQSINLVCCYDNDDNSTTLTGVAQGLDYRNNIQFASVWDNQRFPTLRAQAYSTGNATSGTAFVTTATPAANPRSFKVYGSGLTASTTYLDYTIRMVLQFRGST